MNTTTHTAGPNATAAHADDLAVAAYREARKLGATREAATRAFDLAYAAALRG